MSPQSSIRRHDASHADNSQPEERFKGHLPAGFRPGQKVAEGSFAEIWQVYDARTGEPYALKQLRPEWKDDRSARLLLENEAHVGSAVRSNRVVHVERSHMGSSQPLIVLEWISGVTLEQHLMQVPSMPPGTAIWIARQAVQGLADLAEAGYAHGDVKSSNVFITPRGEAKLIDLGFASSIDVNTARPEGSVFTGTAEYLAPEALTAVPCDPVAKDMYSVGVLLFRMLAGRLPFEAGNTVDVLRMQREVRPPLLRHFCPAAPCELANLVSRLLAKQPLRRPSNLQRLLNDLIGIELQLLSEHSRPEQPDESDGQTADTVHLPQELLA